MGPKEFFAKVVRHLHANVQRMTAPIEFELLKVVPDKIYLEHRYKRLMGKELNLDNPVTFNEKLNWLKLYDRNPLYTTLADKYFVREYIKRTVGKEHLIRCLGVWDSADDINFDSLPKQFVLKCTHDSGSIIVCMDKASINIDELKRKLFESLKSKYWYYSREWAYKSIKPRIVCEEILPSGKYGLLDYKVHCFNGVPRFIEVIGNRDFSNHTGKVCVYNFEWIKQEWTFGDYPQFEDEIPKPDVLDDLYLLAKRMCHDFKYIRLDYYIISNRIYFGEFTFYPSGGFNVYNSLWTEERDIELGGMINLAGEKNE